MTTEHAGSAAAPPSAASAGYAAAAIEEISYMSENAIAWLVAAIIGVFIVAISVFTIPPPRKRRW